MKTYETTLILVITCVLLSTLLSLLLASIVFLVLRRRSSVTFRQIAIPTWIAGLVPAALALFMYENGHGIPLMLVSRDLFVVWAVVQMVSLSWLTTKFKENKKRSE